MRLRPGRLFGDILKTYVGSELRLTETLCPPSFRAPRHSHELFQFCFVIEGGFSEKCGQRNRECTPLTLITHPSDETHANRYYSSGAHCFVVEIGEQWLSRSREYSMMAEVSRRHVKTSESTSPRWLERTRELLKAHFSEEMSLEIIARTVGTHPVHLARVFRQYYGCTIGEYIRQLRVEFACRELSLTDAPLAQIALAAGFYDQSHFSRTFKKIVGLTPTVYRASFRSR